MALWLAQWPGRQRVGGPSGTQGGSPWRDLCQSSEVSVGYSRGPGGAATSCVPGCGSRPTACWPALSSVRVGAAQLWWAAPWVELGGNRSPQGVGTDDAGIAEPTRGDGHVEVGFHGLWFGSERAGEDVLGQARICRLCYWDLSALHRV